MYVYLSIYLYMHACVCVCVCVFANLSLTIQSMYICLNVKDRFFPKDLHESFFP